MRGDGRGVERRSGEAKGRKGKRKRRKEREEEEGYEREGSEDITREIIKTCGF